MNDIEKAISASAACGIVVDYVVGQIEKKEYNVGDRLPPERDLAIQLDVGRTTVREAIKVLNYLGFVESIQGSGNYISNTYDKTTANIMRVMFRRDEVDFHDFTMFRRMLELQAFDLALEHATIDQKKEMKQIVELMDTETDGERIFALDFRFHTLLAEASKSKLIVINFLALSSVIMDYMHNTYHDTVSRRTGGYERLQEYHHIIINALIHKDREAGRQAIVNHFSWLY